jgi:aryl-alcohol dehydrogenase
MKVKSAIVHEPRGRFSISDVTLDNELQPNEVLVKIVATGLCHTDLAVRDQHLPFKLPAVLGHEGAGIVERTGTNVTKVKAGDPVIIAPSSCGKCTYCLSGHPSYCSNFYALNAAGCRPDGSCPYHDENGNAISGFFFGQSSFSTHALTTENNLVKADPEVDLALLGPLGCGMQTGAGTVLNVLKPKPGESIAVFGAGPVGMAGIMAAKAAGCTTIIAVDIHDSRLMLAKELGATHIINSKEYKPSEYITNNILPDGVHYSLDTTGNNFVITQAVSSLRFMGRCALVGVSSAPRIEIDTAVMIAGRSVTYVTEGDSIPGIFIPQLIALYKNGQFPFDKLVKFYDFEDINQAVADTENGTTLKAILKMR